jgi:energy-coupling factor transporter ATP-binding protein EcfA2
MNLRQARIEDNWRRVFRRGYPTRLKHMSFKNLFCLSDATITFSGAINAIVGSNGVGKSTLLAAIVDLLAGGSGAGDSSHRRRLRGSTIEGIVSLSGVDFALKVQDSETGDRIPVGDTFSGEYRWLDPSALAGRCLHQVANDRNFADLLEPLTSLALNEEELAIVNYLVGKSYTDLQIYEIPDYAEFERFPYFLATDGAFSYGSEGMGRGELSLLLAYWTIRDLPPDSILVLEEPETHVSPKSQDCLMKIVAKYCLEKGIWTVIATHSPTVIRRIPVEHVNLLMRGNGPAKVASNVAKVDIALLLGGGIGFAGMFLIEDEAAKDFITAILDEMAPELLKQYEIVVAGAESQISGVLMNMPSTGEWLSIVGIYDGDMKDAIRETDFSWPLLFLPGDVAPEELLTTHISGLANAADLLAVELHKTSEQITLALNHAVGKDPHDYFIELGRSLNLHPSIVRRGGARLWLRNQAGSGIANEFIGALRKAVTNAK